MDILTHLLRSLAPHAQIFFTGEFCGEFSVDTSGNGQAHFHVISRGQCWLETDGLTDARPLQAGDLVMLPHDARHRLLPHPPDTGSVTGEGYVSLICGYFEFASRRANPVLAALPAVVILRASEHASGAQLEQLLLFMRREAEQAAPGNGLALDRLADVLFLYILRALMRDDPQCPDYLRALSDPALARTLEAMHEHPERAWTLNSLAATAALSRTAFAKRFREYVGMTPGSYLTRLRMDLAREWLQAGELSMDDIAERSGYASSAAFAKAFRQVTGEPPGRVRRAARQPHGHYRVTGKARRSAKKSWSAPN